MRAPRTQADFQAFLNREAVRLAADTDQDTEAKIEQDLAIAAEDLEDARHAVEENHASSALNNLEEAIMICGECVAWSLGYKLRDEAANYHARAIECLVLYAEAFVPGLAIYARRFQSLRAARRAMKYDRQPPGEGQLRQFLVAADAFYAQFKVIPVQELAHRREHERQP
jgi:hypothetical protein